MAGEVSLFLLKDSGNVCSAFAFNGSDEPAKLCTLREWRSGCERSPADVAPFCPALHLPGYPLDVFPRSFGSSPYGAFRPHLATLTRWQSLSIPSGLSSDIIPYGRHRSCRLSAVHRRQAFANSRKCQTLCFSRRGRRITLQSRAESHRWGSAGGEDERLTNIHRSSDFAQAAIRSGLIMANVSLEA